MEFPRFVYRSASSHLLVNDETEYESALAAGWYGSVPECPSGEVCQDHSCPDADPETPETPTTDDPKSDPELEPPTREELEAKARELGISFNGNTKDETLLKKINEALAESDETE